MPQADITTCTEAISKIAESYNVLNSNEIAAQEAKNAGLKEAQKQASTKLETLKEQLRFG